MEYRRIKDTVFLRVDPDEDIMEALQKTSEELGITLAEVNGLGALKAFTAGVYDTAEKAFHGQDFTGAFEVTSLHGTITTKDGKYYAHLHLCAGDESGRVYGGHLTRAVVSATAEIVIRCIDGVVERRFDPVTGLNIFMFP